MKVRRQIGRLGGPFPLLFILIISFQSDNAGATVTDFTVDPPEPVMGEEIICTAVDNGQHDVDSYKWEYKYSLCGNWVAAPSSSDSITYGDGMPGTWQVRLTVTYFPSCEDPSPPPPTIITKNITFAPATYVRPVSGFYTPALLDEDITAVFKIMANARECGPNISAIAQEFLIDKEYSPAPPFPFDPPDDPDWSPNQPSPLFHISENTIVDIKGQDNYPWQAVPFPAFVYYEATQKLRLKYTDPCGQVQIIPLGSIRVRRVRHDANHWLLSWAPIEE